MSDIVETAQGTEEVVEANDKKKEAKLPEPIYLRTAGGSNSIIVMEAINKTSYTKSYFENVDTKKPLTDPRRTKTVQLPVNREGINFATTMDLFVHLTKECGYQRF